MRTLLALLLIAPALLVGCDSDDGGSGSGGTLTAQVGGTAFTAAAVTATFSGGALVFGGSSVSNPPRQINISIPGAQAGQTYTLGAGGGSSATATWVEGTTAADMYVASLVSGSGSITIQTLTADGATGTFSFTGSNNASATRQVTSGQFDVEFAAD